MSEEMMLGITKIGQIAFSVKDIERATGFYRDILEVPFLFRYGDLVFFQCGEVRLLLEVSNAETEKTHNSILYFQVADIQQAYDKLRAREVHFLNEPHMVARMPDHELWMVFFHDSEENTLVLMCEVRAS